MKCDTCYKYLVCNGETQLGNGTCASPNSFCDAASNTCTNVKPASCDTSITADFNCPEEGFFPNPSKCETYYFCDSAKKAELWECPANYVYDAVNGACKRKVYATDCVLMTCKTANTFVVHTGNPNFYAFCNAELTPTLFKCPNNMQFVTGCKYVCKTEGYHAGSSKSEVFHCSKSGLTWVQNIYKCPTGYEYNASFTCVKAAA